MSKSTKNQKILSILLLIIMIVLIVLPLLTVLIRAVVNDDGRLDFMRAIHTIAQKQNLETIKNSLMLGFAVVIISSLIAFPLAFLLTRTQFAKWKWLDIILLIPFMTPPYISSMGWILFLQKRGLFQQLFPQTGSASEKLFSFFGLALIMSFHVFPFMTTMIKNALLNIDVGYEESAKISGSGSFRTLIRITLSLLKGNYAIAALLVFVKTLSEYGTPATLGKKIGFYVFTTDIHRYATTSPIDFGKSAGLSSVLIGICMVMWLFQSFITNKNTYSLVSGKGRRRPQYKKTPAIAAVGGIYISLVILFAILIPYFSVIVTSLIKLRGYGMRAGNYTFQHYISLFTQDQKAIKALFTSGILSLVSASIASVIGTITVVCKRKAGKLKKAVEGCALIPEMIPNIVLVIGMMLFWNKLYDKIPLYNTIWFMILVYTIMFLPYSIQYVSSAVMQIGENLTDAGKIFGAGNIDIFRKITFPLIFKGILGGWMMIFIIVFRELVASSLIAPPDTLTVSTFIVREFEQGSVSEGMAMAVICVLFTTTALILLNIFASKRGETA